MASSRKKAPLCAFALAVLALAGAAHPVQDARIKELSRLVARQRDKVDPSVFDELASFGGEESFLALEKALELLKRAEPRGAALWAFRLYAEKEELALRAIQLLDATIAAGKGEEDRQAARCLLQFGDRASVALERILREDEDPVVRRIACDPLVPVLGRRDDPESLQLLLANASPNAERDFPYLGLSAREVDIYAEWTHREVVRRVLARNEGPGKRALLLAKLTDEGSSRAWKLLLLEILAEREGDDVDQALARVLADRDASVVLEAMDILGGRGEWEDLEPKLRPLMRHADVAVRRAAVVALGRHGLTDPGWQREVLELARSNDASLRMGAAAALAELRTGPAIESLYSLLSDPLWSVRVEALDHVVRLRRKDSIPLLIERMQTESGRLRRDVHAALRMVTGLDLGRLPERWLSWWQDEGERFEVPTHAEALRAEQDRRQRNVEGGTRATAFYGVRVVSERVVFVLDISGSMRLHSGEQPGELGDVELTAPTRMDVAKRELSDVIRRLPDETLFNIVFFESEVSSLEKKLVRMRKSTRQKSLRFISEQYAVGSTALYPALELAFEDPLVDTIYLLSDGAPTVGEITDIVEIRAEVRRWNSARHVRIHGIALGQDSTLLRWLTEDTGGTYLRVD